MTAPVRFTMADAIARHGLLQVADITRMERNRPSFIGTCVLPDGEFCFHFAEYSSRESLEDHWVEHAASELGICWACSQPENDWPNRNDCHRCWLMWNAHQGVLPRDAPPRPGAGRR